MAREEFRFQKMEMSNRLEFRSKLVDGLLSALVLVLLSLMLALLIRPIEIIFQRPGLFIYMIIILAVAIFSLERCIAPIDSEIIRAWWGILGGVFTWGVIEMSDFIGTRSLTSETGLISMVMVALIVGVLWQGVLSLGVRFFSVALLGGWIGHLGLYYVDQLLSINSGASYSNNYPIPGIVVLGLVLVILIWNFVQSKSRLARLWGAMVLWMCLMLLIYIFRGAII